MSVSFVCVEETQREGPGLPGTREVSRLSASTRSVTCSICWGDGPVRVPHGDRGKVKPEQTISLAHVG